MVISQLLINQIQQMNARCYLFLLFSVLTWSASAQTKLHYTLSAEAHALMCPYLSPKLMELLSKKGATDLSKDAQMQLHFYTTKENELSDTLIFDLIDQIGYEAKNFSIKRELVE